MTYSQYKENASQKYEKIESLNVTATSASDKINNIKEDVNNIKEEITQKLNAIEVKKEEVDKFFIKTFGEEDEHEHEHEHGNYSGGFKDRLFQKEQEISEFIIDQKNQYEQLFSKIESLLPAATSTGLAIAYSNQKNSYRDPGKVWIGIFIFSLISLCVTGLLSIKGFNKISFEILELEKLLTRAPVFLPLIWLAAFSSKQYRQNKRLEQEYAHKEVLARTYQGYKKEFESQNQDTDKEILSKLNAVLITAISKNPSEIMDDGHSEDTPSIWKRLFGPLSK